MPRLSALVLVATLAGACSPSPATTSADTSSNARIVYVSLVQKGTVRSFLNRLASPDAQLVVTSTPVAGALESQVLRLDDSEHVMLVELQAGSPTRLPGEKFRLGSFAVAVLPLGADQHTAFGSKSYAEDIGERDIVLGDARPRDPQSLHAKGGVLERAAISIDQSFLETKLKELSGAVPATINGATVTISERRSTAGRANARAYLKQEYERLGFTTSEQRYGTFTPGVNFIAEKVGTDPTKVLLLTSHLDNVGNAGADDNGAGTISALAIAQALKAETLRYTLRVVAFDQEELGLYGSKAYAKSLNAAGTIHGLVGVVNLEMLGYDSDNDGAFHVIDCNENTSADLTALISQVVTRDALALQIVDACTDRSDHAAFWTYDVPAVVVSQNYFGGDDNPCYHKTCDKVDRMNFAYMTKITTAVGRGLEDLLVVP